MKIKLKLFFVKLKLGLTIKPQHRLGEAKAKLIAPDWSQLPNDIWCLIGENLSDTPDRARFRSVCKTWRSLIPPPRKAPLLMLAQDKGIRKPRRFFCLDGSEGVLQHKLPEAYNKRVVGSTGNWLTTVDLKQRVCLLNPFSRCRVNLPPQTEFEHDERSRDLTPEVLRDAFIAKVVLSSSPLSSDCVAMAIHHSPRKLAIARPGDPRWTGVQAPVDYCADVIFYRNQFYVINHFGELMVCDIRDGLSPPQAVRLSTAHCPNDLTYSEVAFKYLVEWMGELVYVIKFMYYNPASCYNTKRFELYVFDSTNETWSRLESLGDYSLFLGTNTSVALLASQYPGITRNCIYFTDDVPFKYSISKVPAGEDMGVFDMEDDSRGVHYKGISTSYFSPPHWIIPSDQC